jgi:hypothetical protein
VILASDALAERAAHLVDHVFPVVPIRQWVLTLLAALTPRPRINLVLYYGVLAARAAWRPRLQRDGLPTGALDEWRDGRHLIAAGRRARPSGAPAVESALGAAHGPEFPPAKASAGLIAGRGAPWHLSCFPRPGVVRGDVCLRPTLTIA